MTDSPTEQDISMRKNERVVANFSLIPSFPKEILLEPNNTCNHSCFFCANAKMTRSRKYLDIKLGFKLLAEAYALGTRAVGLYATAEPFMHPQMEEYIKEAKKIGYEYIFVDTNGSLLDEKRAQKSLDAGLDSIKFSINAGTRKTYKEVHGRDDFDKVINNVKWISDHRKRNNHPVRLYVSMTQTEKSKDEWKTLAEILEPYVDKIIRRECSNQGGTMLENNQTEKINKENLLGSRGKTQFKISCTEPFNRLTVSSEGYLAACVVDYGNNLIIADLNKTSLEEAWSSPRYQEFRKMHLDNNLKGTICYNCVNNIKQDFKALTPEFMNSFKR